MNRIRKIKDFLKKIPFLHAVVRRFRERYRYPYDVFLTNIGFNILKILKILNIVRKDPFIISLKNKYKGKRIFIVATGPSLLIEDLELLKMNNEITISFNSIFKILDKTDWKPSFYIMDDWYLIDRYEKQGWMVDYSSIPTEGCIFSHKVKRYLKSYNINKTGFFRMNYLDHWYTSYSKKFKYNRDISVGAYDFYTVTNTAINLADYMGAKEVFLLGVDNNFGSVGDLHIGEKEINIEDFKKQSLQMKKTEYCQRNGFKMLKLLIGSNVCIYNATRGGLLEEFNRCNFDEVIKDRS